MYHGCVKKVTHERQVVKADGTSATEQRELSIDVSFFLPHCVLTTLQSLPCSMLGICHRVYCRPQPRALEQANDAH